MRIAEERIEQLEGTIKQLEELVDKNPKRALPARGANDSPELYSDKRSRALDPNFDLEGMASITPVISTPAKKPEIQLLAYEPAVRTSEHLKMQKKLRKLKVGLRVKSVVSNNFGETYGLATTRLFKTLVQIKNFKPLHQVSN